MEHHKHHLASYLKSHKARADEGPAPSLKSSQRTNDKMTTGQGSPARKPRPEQPQSRSLTPVAKRPMSKALSQKQEGLVNRRMRKRLPPAQFSYLKIDGKIHINSFPDEIVYKIFEFLNPQDLLASARVCRRWNAIANDNVLWQGIYQQHARKVVRGQKAIKIPKNPPASFWKSVCITRGAEFRNGRALPLLKKIHPFTGLPKATQDALQKSGVRWVASLVDLDGDEFSTFHNDVFYFHMSACVRWYSLSVPSVHRIRRLRLYAANPVFYDSNGRGIPNSPCQRSLLYEMDFRLSEMVSSREAVSSDDVIDLYSLPSAVCVATWKGGGDLAFITKVFHADNLVTRCLLGNNVSRYLPPAHKPKRDDVDQKYGLHSYTCTMELHNQRNSFWSQQFLNLHCLPDFQDHCAVIQAIDPERSYDRSPIGKKIAFPWKTDALKGIVPNACFLDFTLLDERSKPMWCSSSLVKVSSPEDPNGVNYEYEGHNFHVGYEDDCGKVLLDMIWDSRDQQYFITNLQLHLSLAFINKWFATSY